jgi:hypothetical protein
MGWTICQSSMCPLDFKRPSCSSPKSSSKLTGGRPVTLWTEAWQRREREVHSHVAAGKVYVKADGHALLATSTKSTLAPMTHTDLRHSDVMSTADRRCHLRRSKRAVRFHLI